MDSHNHMVAIEDECKRSAAILCSEELGGRHWDQPGGHAAAAWIHAELQSFGVYSFLDFLPRPHRSKSPNVIAMIPGKVQDILLLTAHYDHLGISDGEIHPGADDNASGVSVLLALAKDHLTNVQPYFTCVFAFFTGEEFGMFGSKAAARWMFADHSDHNVRAMVNLDMVGRNADGKSVIFGCSKGNRRIRKSLTQEAKKEGIRIVWDKRNEWLDRSDQVNFLKKCPCILLSVEDHDDYHKSTDTPDKLNFNLMARLTSALIHLIKDKSDQSISS